MLDYNISKPLGFALIVTVHMVFSGPSQATITRSCIGNKVTLDFTFANFPNPLIGSASLYRANDTKISECAQNVTNCSKSNTCVFKKEAKSASYCIENLTLSDNGLYWVTLFRTKGQMLKSNNVSLIAQEKNSCSTVAPSLTEGTVTDPPKDKGRPFLHLVLVLVVSSAVLLAGFLSLVIWSLKRTKVLQQQDPKPTVQETEGATNHVPAPSVVYSVLDFPKRSQGGVEVQPTDTEYATISYLPNQRRA